MGAEDDGIGELGWVNAKISAAAIDWNLISGLRGRSVRKLGNFLVRQVNSPIESIRNRSPKRTRLCHPLPLRS